MDTHIIRIYRYEKDNPKRIVGTVETVGEEVKTAFTTYDELWKILNPQKGEKRAKQERGMKRRIGDRANG